MSKKSLRTKFVGSISLVILISLIITSVVMFLITTSLFWKSKEDSLEEAALLGQANVSAWFSDNEQLLTTVADDMRLFGSADKDAIQDYLSEYPKNYNYLVDVYLALPNKEMYSGTYWVPDPDYDARQRSWYKDAQAAKGLVYTDPYIDAMSGLMVITLSIPAVDKDGRDMGVMAMDIKLDSLVSYINDTTIQDTSGSAFLLDKNQNFIAHENTAFLPRIEGENEIYTSFDESGIVLGKNIAEGMTLAKSKNYDGRSSYVSIITIPENGWSYGFAVPISDYNSVFIQLLLEWVGISLLMVVVSMVLAYLITSKLLQPIQTIIRAAGRLAQGDVHVDINVDSQDELGDLSNQFRSMISSTSQQINALNMMANGDFSMQIEPKCPEDELSIAINSVICKLRDLILQINTSASQVSDGSSQIANGAQALALGSTEQAATIQQLSASLETILGITQHNAQNAQIANQNVELILQKANDGTVAMDKMVDAVKRINSSSNDITKVIKVIDDIAFQTNILALNAAVEAARAGQHGKGFAVVADEVRNLASKSAEAAKTTTDLISDSADKSADGMHIAHETQAILAEISQRIMDTAALMKETSQTSDKQVEEIQHINQGVTQVSQVVQQNSATAEESAAASEEMSAQAATLENMMNMFKIGDSGNIAPQHSQKSSAWDSTNSGFSLQPDFDANSKY